MAQGFSKRKSIAIIGGGPAGIFCALNSQNFCDLTIFEADLPLKTLLPTGGGRCNLSHDEKDFKELAKCYPRGEKFLYSIFSKFGLNETLDFFKALGLETYTQDDGRIFPTSDSAKDVRKKMLNALKCKIVNEKVINIDKELIVTTNREKHKFDAIVIAIGGHSGFEILKNTGHNIIEPKPALLGLKTDKIFTSGVVLKKVRTKIGNINLCDDLLFTHQGISGPLAFKISSINARADFPYKIHLNLVDNINLQELFNKNPHKSLKNILAEFLPKSFAYEICPEGETKCSHVNALLRKKVEEILHNFELTVTGVCSGGEVVMSGGIDLDEVNSKTMMSKLVPNLYFCGEVLNIDGFCGGYNLQNCWSTGFVASDAIVKNL